MNLRNTLLVLLLFDTFIVSVNNVPSSRPLVLLLYYRFVILSPRRLIIFLSRLFIDDILSACLFLVSSSRLLVFSLFLSFLLFSYLIIFVYCLFTSLFISFPPLLNLAILSRRLIYPIVYYMTWSIT